MRTKRQWHLSSRQPKGLPVYAVDYVAEHDTYGNKLSEEFGKSVEKTSLAELSRCVREKCIGYGKLIATETTESANAFHDIRLYQTAQEDARVVMIFNESTTKKVTAKLVFEKTKQPFLSATQYNPWNNTATHFGIAENELPIEIEPGEAQFLWLSPKRILPLELLNSLSRCSI